MNKLRILISILSAYFAVINIAFAVNCPNPDLECNCEPWGLSQNSAFDYYETGVNRVGSAILINGQYCYYDVLFKVRNCICDGDTVHEIQIEKIAFHSGCNSVANMGAVMFTAVGRLLLESESIFNVPYPFNPYHVSIYAPSCWKAEQDIIGYKDGNPIYGNWRYVACVSSDCCLAKYSLINADDKISVIDKTINNTQIICGGPTNPDCSYICDQMDIPYGPLPFFSEASPTTECNDGSTSSWLRRVRYSYNYITAGGKVINAYISYRITTQGNLELTIDQIYLPSDLNWSNCDILHNLAGKLLTYADEIFRYNNSTPRAYPLTCTLRLATCWIRANPSKIAPCDFSDCCAHEYTVYRPDPINQPQRFRISSQGWISGGNGEVCSGEGCENICNCLFLNGSEDLPSNINDRMFPKVSGNSKEYKQFENANKNDNGLTYVVPVPANGETEFHFISTENGKAVLKVYNSIGEEVYSAVLNKDTEQIIWQMDASKLLNGAYFYNISINGKTLIGDSFIISK